MSGVSGAFILRTFNFYLNWLSGTGTFQWAHNFPADFEIRPNVVNSVSLYIIDREADDQIIKFRWKAQQIGGLIQAVIIFSTLVVHPRGIPNGLCYKCMPEIGFPGGINAGIRGLELIISTFQLDYDK